MYPQHQRLGNALVAFVLEVMFGRPEGVVAQTIHKLRHGLCFVEDRHEMLVGKAAVVYGRSSVSDVVHVDMACIQTIEFGNHAAPPHGEAPKVVGGIIPYTKRWSNSCLRLKA